jgi:Tetratricopeptide repeat
MGNVSSVFDCATNPLNPALEDDAGEGEGSENRTLTLEEGVPLRSSLLWRLQRAFYEDKGLTAWSEGIVPNFVTSNSFIARGYARSILSLLQDVYGGPGEDEGKRNPNTDYTQPVYIIELGAGHGKLGYLVCEALLRYRAFFPKTDCPWPFKFVLTDTIERDVEAWSVHPNLKEFIELGVLDTAVFDAERDSGFTLRKSGLKISGKGALLNPCIVIANYCFDSLTTDALRLENGNLQQCNVTLSIASHFLSAAKAVAASDAATRQGAAHKEDSGNGSENDGNGMRGPLSSSADGGSDIGAAGGAGGSAAGGSGGVTVPVQIPVASSIAAAGAPPASSSSPASNTGAGAAASAAVAPTTASAAAPAKRTVFVSPSLLTRMELTWSYTPLPNISASPAGSPNDHSYRVYGEPFLDGLVSAYARSPYLQSAGSLLLPLGGFAAMRTMLKLSNGRMAVFVGDKGYSRLNEMEGLRDPHLALHGSLSFMVNLHSLRQFAKAHGGVVLQTPHYEGFKTSVLLFGSENASTGPITPLTASFPVVASASTGTGASTSGGGFSDEEDDLDLGISSLQVTKPSYKGELEAFRSNAAPPKLGAVAASPLLPASSSASLPYRRLRLSVAEHLTDGFTVDDFSTLQRNIKDECPEPSLKHILALLALACHDADVFYKFKATMIEKTPTAPADTVLRDVRSDVDRLFAGYYPLQKSKDICFECGRLLMGVRDYQSAIDFFARSNELCGEHHVTWHNMGICCYYLGDYDNALECFKSSLSLKSDYAEARLWWDKASSKRTSLANQQQHLHQQSWGSSRCRSSGS